ncbi:MAG TPA: KpsF/GutQ family sugar-phosphate isomerase [Pseudomonadales bacterium]|nr:KpsF/GutQ family sugar-phosphate isomerase [Pseudomonadales bacterium]
MKTDYRTFDFLGSARRTLTLESAALTALEARLDMAFVQACLLMLDCQGRVVVTGMGKSGHVANKISSTLASTGTPAFFVHPAEASHGDLGMITRQDVVLALSNSGTTAEVLAIVPLIKRMQARLISMTGDAASPLARAAEVHLDVAVAQEACPLGLAPTASTTTALAMGDALAVALLEARGFTAEQFAFSHPGGSLGRRLLLKVEDLMHGDESVPRVTASTPLRDALAEISRCGFGLTSVVDGQGRMIGIFTDGDLRRVLDRGLDVRATSVAEVMTPKGAVVQPEQLAVDALQCMEARQIMALIVVDEERRPVGVLHMHDLVRSGVV